MGTVRLAYTIVTDPDSLVAFKYYVKPGAAFNADDFAATYKLRRADLDPDDVTTTEEAANQLSAGEWLMVLHSVAA